MLFSIFAFLAINALFACAATSSSRVPKDQRAHHRHSVSAVYHKNHERNGTAALLRAYAKHGLTPSKYVSRAFLSELAGKHHDKVHRHVARQDSSAVASPAPLGIEYLVPVTVGKQALNLNFDTGSSDLWLFSSLLPAFMRAGHNYYTPNISTSYSSLAGYTWDIMYADGSGASGVCGTDIVHVGDTVVLNQTVELANRVSNSFINDYSDGLLGLGFANINQVRPQRANPFFDNAEASLDSPLFAAYLPRLRDGSYDFGYIDSAKYTGKIFWTPISSSRGFWQFPSPFYRVGNKTYTNTNATTAIADTGTTLLLTNDGSVRNYYALVPGAVFSRSFGGYVFPCASALPPFTLAVGRQYATIPSSLMNFAVATSDGKLCFGSLQSAGTGNMHVYGDIFMNEYYSIFDQGRLRFGFAKLV